MKQLNKESIYRGRLFHFEYKDRRAKMLASAVYIFCSMCVYLLTFIWNTDNRCGASLQLSVLSSYLDLWIENWQWFSTTSILSPKQFTHFDQTKFDSRNLSKEQNLVFQSSELHNLSIGVTRGSYIGLSCPRQTIKQVTWQIFKTNPVDNQAKSLRDPMLTRQTSRLGRPSGRITQGSRTV